MLRPLASKSFDWRQRILLGRLAALGLTVLLWTKTIEAAPDLGFPASTTRLRSLPARNLPTGGLPLASLELNVALDPVTPVTWLGVEFQRPGRLRLPIRSEFPLLARYSSPGTERSLAHREAFGAGPYGRRSWSPWSHLELGSSTCLDPDSSFPDLAAASWSVSPLNFAHQAPQDWEGLLLRGPRMESIPRASLEVLPTWILDSATPPEPEVLSVEAETSCPPYRLARPVNIVRYGMEQDSFRLTDCDGAIAPEALDRLSVLARPPLTPRPDLPLPAEPDNSAPPGEWVKNVKLVHPRLVWALQQIAYSFPGRPIYIVSGYRPDSGTSNHALGRALDLFVMGATNEKLLAVCRSLPDIGCGYYPNNHFVHVDVRPVASGHPLWIDISGPGERSQYVSSWPGVVEGGALEAYGEL